MRDGRQVGLRRALVHLVGETARDAGHADLVREAIDGTVQGVPPGAPEHTASSPRPASGRGPPAWWRC